MALDNLLDSMNGLLPKYIHLPVNEVLTALREQINVPLREKLSRDGYQWFLHDRGLIDHPEYDPKYVVNSEDEDEVVDELGAVYGEIEGFYFPNEAGSQFSSYAESIVRPIIEDRWDELYFQRRMRTTQTTDELNMTVVMFTTTRRVETTVVDTPSTSARSCRQSQSSR